MNILPTAPVLPKTDKLLYLQRKSDVLPPLSVGEVVEAEIIEGTRSGKATILLKGAQITADSDLSLAKGDKVYVRVAHLQPGVVLKIVRSEAPRRAELIDYLRSHLSNPKALSEVLLKGVELFGAGKEHIVAAQLGREEMEVIGQLLRSLPFSGENLDDPLFLRNYVHRMGYLLERELGESIRREASGGRPVNADENLKALLIRLGDRLRALMDSKGLSGAKKLSDFVSSSLKLIESHQVINYLLQENEGKYMFQIPLLFPEQRGMAEIFVKFEDRNKEAGEGRSGGKNVLFLLDMDALGEVIAEASIDGKKIGCVLRCDNSTVCDFIKPFMGKLSDSLESLGYEVGYMQCLVSQRETDSIPDMSYREFQNLCALEGVDLLV